MNQKELIDDETSRQQIEQAHIILARALYSFEVYRNVNKYFKKERPLRNSFEEELWSHIANDCLQMGIIQWTKVFGAESNNQLHYTNWICQRELVFRLKEKGVDAKKVYEEMTRFRNKYAAHKDVKAVVVPNLDGPIQTIYVFGSAMRERYEMEWLSEEFWNLESIHEAYQLRIQGELESLGYNGTRYLFVK